MMTAKTKVVLFWTDSAGFRNELRTDTEGRAALWSEEVEDREIWATNDSFAQAVADELAALAAEVEKLRRALESSEYNLNECRKGSVIRTRIDRSRYQTITRLREALAKSAIPLVALAATECKADAWSIDKDLQHQILDSLGTIRRALEEKP